MRKIAVIIGNGKLPVYFLREALQKGIELYPIGLFETVDEEVKQHEKFKAYNIGQFSEIVKYLLMNDVHEMIMLGKVEKEMMFKNIELDDIGKGLLSKMPDQKDETLLFGIISFFKLMGIKVLPQTLLIKDFLFQKKCYTKIKPKDEDMETVKIGIEAAKALSKVDCGQCVICKNRSVVALEGIEGTDKCIKRGGELAGTGTIIVKMSRPQQDMRVDVPAIGMDTIKKGIEIGACGIVVEANKMLFLEEKKCVETADENNMFILGI